MFLSDAEKTMNVESEDKENQKYNVGDILLHKMKGQPYWPVKVIKMEMGR